MNFIWVYELNAHLPALSKIPPRFQIFISKTNFLQKASFISPVLSAFVVKTIVTVSLKSYVASSNELFIKTLTDS